LEEFAVHLNSTRLKRLISTIALGGYLIYA